MGEPFIGKLQLWEGRPPSSPAERVAAATPPSQSHLQVSPDYTDHLYASETLGPPNSQSRDGAEPYSLQWFLDIESLRHGRYAKWLPSLLEFTKHSGETLLGLGTGLGTDWVQYARNGASVIVACPTAEHLGLIRRHFELRQLSARFLPMYPGALPVESASIDVVCVSHLLHHARDPRVLIDEVYRVLKPGGKVLAVTDARYDIDFWRRLLLPWQRWFERRRDAEATATRFTGRSLRGLFQRFSEHRVHKRHLRRSDIPHLWRLLPRHLLERLAGRMLVLKAFKPLSTAIHLPVAA